MIKKNIKKTDVAIRATSITKIYPLYNSTRDRLKEALHPKRKIYHNDFHALSNVSFEIKKGETVGIIGQNGSGKSTLLKILSSVLTPTNGFSEVNGKVSTLLELGTGFNPELSGIENVYFFGTIQGFSKTEMDAKLEDILNFADIGEFVHQPVKNYSSGMYVRLAFAVAINIDPDILIIDEALAVGDIRFQQKCFRKINDFREAGKTILFCSHDTAAVLNFCTSCIWINDGAIKEYGEPSEIVEKYLAWINFENIVIDKISNTDIPQKTTIDETSKMIDLWRDITDCSQFGDGGANILSVAFYDENNININTLEGSEKVNLAIKAKFNDNISNIIFGFTVKNRHGESVFGNNTFVENFPVPTLKKGETETIIFSFILPNIANGTYAIDVSVASGTQVNHIQHSWVYESLVFSVINNSPKADFGFVFVKSKDIVISMG